jgi:hypothetical protein
MTSKELKKLKELKEEMKGTLARHPELTGIGLGDGVIAIRVLSPAGKEQIAGILQMAYPDAPVDIVITGPIVAC